MKLRYSILDGLVLAALAGCALNASATGPAVKSVRPPPPEGTSTSAAPSAGLPAMVTVNLAKVLNDLSVRLNVDRSRIPVSAQVPIDVAAKACGVPVTALSVATGGVGTCTAKVAGPQLTQVVQQQIAAAAATPSK